MSTLKLPLLLEPHILESYLYEQNLLVVEITRAEQYTCGHIPSSIHISPEQLVSGTPPAPGALPNTPKLKALIQQIGLSPNTHVVAYDDEGGGWAGRFIWTLDMLGHSYSSFLNGGIHAWVGSNLPLELNPNKPEPTDYNLEIAQHGPNVDKTYILQHYQDPTHCIWDARSLAEYQGLKKTDTKSGHIPGAKHYEWTQALDQNNYLKLRPLDNIQAELDALNITKDKTVITHCRTHHRSGLTYFVGKLLGFPKIKAYAGSWSEWGNDMQTPIETTQPPTTKQEAQ